MKNLCIILVVSAILNSSIGLRADNEPAPKYFSAPVYEKGLNDVQTRFEHQIDQLKAQINQVNAIIQDASKSTGVKVVSMSQKMADQRNSLYDIQQFLNVPFQLKTCECKELGPQQKANLQSKSTEINNKIASLKQQIDQCSRDSQNCAENTYMVEQLKNMKIYMDTINSIINSDCCRQRLVFKQQQPGGIVDMSNYLYKDNLKATNWFYGNMTQETYKLKMFQLSTKYNVTTCPISKPYANVEFNRCEKCDQDGSFFDLGSRNCYHCGKLAFFNATTLLCQACPPNQYYNGTKRACQACSSQHILNKQTGMCQPCPVNQHFDISTGQCKQCPDNTEYDRLNQVCRACNTAAGQFLNKTIGKCQSCPFRLLYNATTQKCELCPNNNSYYQKSTGTCVQCIKQVLNLKTMNCQSCPNGSYFHTVLKKCVTCPPGYKYDSVNQHCVLINQTVPTPVPPPVDTNTTVPSQSQCPAQLPLYNTQLKRCEACPPGTEYSPHQNECLNLYGTCPHEKPFFNIYKNQCEDCPEGTTYSPATFNCHKNSHLAVTAVEK